MSSVDGVLFTNTEGPDWVRSIARGRARRNLIAAQIHAALGKPISAAEPGIDTHDTLTKSTLGKVVSVPGSDRVLSPAVPKTNTMTDSDAPADEAGAAGAFNFAPPLTESRLHDVGTAWAASRQAAGLSCAVGSATAGRDRRFFVLS